MPQVLQTGVKRRLVRAQSDVSRNATVATCGIDSCNAARCQSSEPTTATSSIAAPTGGRGATTTGGSSGLSPLYDIDTGGTRWDFQVVTREGGGASIYDYSDDRTTTPFRR